MEKIQLNSRSIEKDLFIKTTPDHVFQALTEKDKLERWFVTKAEVDPHPGGALRFEWGPDLYNFGTILVLEPPRRFSYTWEAADPGFTTLTFTLAAENDGTRLHLVHTGTGKGENWDQYYANGWSMHLQYLATWLETGKERTW